MKLKIKTVPLCTHLTFSVSQLPTGSTCTTLHACRNELHYTYMHSCSFILHSPTFLHSYTLPIIKTLIEIHLRKFLTYTIYTTVTPPPLLYVQFHSSTVTAIKNCSCLPGPHKLPSFAICYGCVILYPPTNHTHIMIHGGNLCVCGFVLEFHHMPLIPLILKAYKYQV